jgi:diguanylate cyclase (GGDEF)-like protein/PAS domain S-box-containing protein
MFGGFLTTVIIPITHTVTLLLWLAVGLKRSVGVFKTIGTKLTLSFVFITTIGLLVMVTYFTVAQEKQIVSNNELLMGKVTESVSQGLQAVMLGGYADIAQTYAQSLQSVPGIVDFRILRIDGTEAFLDNTTIDNVNTRKDEELFEPRDKETQHIILDPNNKELIDSISLDIATQFYTYDDAGNRVLTFINPIKNAKDCYDCHGSEDSVRGIVMLSASLAEVDQAIANTRSNAYKLSIAFIVAIIIVTGFMVRRTIVRPINLITRAIHKISGGDLDQIVPEFGKDELAFMAKSFNQMSHELQTTYLGLKEEHDKITTLIHSTTEGMVVTDRHGRIVLTNPAAEFILQKSTDDIIIAGFLHLVDDTEVIREQINSLQKPKGPTQVAYRNRVIEISASTIYNNEDEQIGTAALIRDVTESVELNKELQLLSTSDGLTGLYNRRFLDTKLAYETERSSRYKTELTVLLFDVDHFKKFNDTHGHDQGDRVLQAIAGTVKHSLRTVDVACRYGGEEFLVILPETDLEGGMLIAERIRKRIATTTVDGLYVTVSIGVASSFAGNLSSPEQLIKLADQGLYAAKDSGRNVVITLQN